MDWIFLNYLSVMIYLAEFIEKFTSMKYAVITIHHNVDNGPICFELSENRSISLIIKINILYATKFSYLPDCSLYVNNSRTCNILSVVDPSF